MIQFLYRFAYFAISYVSVSMTMLWVMTHTITFLPSGRSVRCPDNRKILDAGLESGVLLPFSCRAGFCRTCRGHVVEGTVELGDVHAAYLTEADRRAGFVHLCQARARTDCTIEIEEVDPASALAAQAMPARILSLTKLAPDVMALRLGTPPNEPVRYYAGQYIDVFLEDGVRRSYSIANPPESAGVNRLELHVRHMPGGRFTDRVFGALAARDILRIVVPQGRFFLREETDKPIILVCSGTGFAPIKAIVEYSLARGLRRPMQLYWGGRRRQDLYLDGLVRDWAQTYPHIAYTPVLSEPGPECRWHGRTGFVHEAVLEDWADLAAFQAYVSGAPAMVEAARRDFTSRAGLPEREFLSDSFVSEADRAADPLLGGKYA